VFVEGNSFTEFVNADHFIMVRQASNSKIKSSARRLMDKATAIYVSDITEQLSAAEQPPIFIRSDLPALIDHLRTCVQRSSSEFKL
jgi:GTP:adenosylcobinamide-phosphate guanylyltransferase